MAEIDDLRTVHARLAGNEPLRLLVGERLLFASEIVLTPTYGEELRRHVSRDILDRIAALQAPPEDPPPQAPAAAMAAPVEGGRGDRPSSGQDAQVTANGAGSRRADERLSTTVAARDAAVRT